MNNQDDFVLLFPTYQQQNEEQSFSEDNYQEHSSQVSSLEQNDTHLDYEQQEIDEEILKKTSELHQAMRNIKLLRFQMIQSKIIKKSNLKKCEQLERDIEKNQQKKLILEQENQQLENTIKLYRQKILRQKESNRYLSSNLQNLNNRLLQARIQHKNILSNNDLQSICQDKENISRIENQKYLQLQKISLFAQNQSSEQSIQALKQQISITRQKFKAKEKRKKQLQAQYQKLIQDLKKQQMKKVSENNQQIKQKMNSNLSQKNNLQEINDGIKEKTKQHSSHNLSITQFSQHNPMKQQSKCVQKSQKNIKTQNKDKNKAKNIVTSNSTLKKNRIF